MNSVLWRPEELEEVPCDFCRTNNCRPLFVRPDGMQVVECVSCRLTYLNPRPKPESVARLYEQEYFTKSTGETVVGYSDYTSPRKRLAQTRFAEAKLKLIEPLWQAKGKRCLEVGCATGEFCHVLEQHGAKAVGIDLSEFVIREARQNYPGVKFQVGDVEGIPSPASFDAVFAFEVIEHVLSPIRFLRSARRLLIDGGMLVLSTPNLDCGRHVRIERWMGFHISLEHLYFFDHRTLAKLGNRAGYSPKAVFTSVGSGIIATGDSQPLKQRVRMALARLGLLEKVRNYRRALQPPAIPSYTDSLHGHNLLVVLEAAAPELSASES